jgi:seryl-tRNA synthetase
MIGDAHLGPEIAHEAGRLRLHGVAAALAHWFDDEFRARALDQGAVDCRFPATLTHDTLERAGYFSAFPGGASEVGPDAAGHRYFLCPAVCYHAYAWLDGASLAAPIVLTAAQTCFRETDRGARLASRLWEFTMREVIFVGPADWVVAGANQWVLAIDQIVAGLGLDAALEPASDLFFGPAARGRRLIQQIKGLKRELRFNIDGVRVAAASINLHETHFSSRFGIRLADGGEAQSACVAFGLERWALAFLSQRGGEAAAELIAAARTTRV